ncbi:MAG: hypothetical protein ACTSU2_09955 [Promethearchaeota archaeon]
MRRHQRSFFGQKVGMIFDSGDYTQENIYLTFIRKLEDDSWEKPSLKQGKKIKLNLGEILMFRSVLMGTLDKWTTVHKYDDNATSISISHGKQREEIWFNVERYSKNLQPPETEILLLILTHVIEEKIKYATGVPESENPLGNSTNYKSAYNYNHNAVPDYKNGANNKPKEPADNSFEGENSQISAEIKNISAESQKEPNKIAGINNTESSGAHIKGYYKTYSF